jgi:hypothetical protein
VPDAITANSPGLDESILKSRPKRILIPDERLLRNILSLVQWDESFSLRYEQEQVCDHDSQKCYDDESLHGIVGEELLASVWEAGQIGLALKRVQIGTREFVHPRASRIVRMGSVRIKLRGIPQEVRLELIRVVLLLSAYREFYSLKFEISAIIRYHSIVRWDQRKYSPIHFSTCRSRD